MASRRQKFKPLAGIQKASTRRAQNTVSESIAKDVIKTEDAVSVKIEVNKTEQKETVADIVEASTSQSCNADAESKPSENVDPPVEAPSEKPSDPPESKPSVQAAPRPMRRSMKPAVVIPDRRRKLAQTEVKAEENSDKAPTDEPAEKISRKALSPVTPLAPLKLKQENSDNIQKPIASDDTFKPPFLSPSTQLKRPEFVYNPLDQTPINTEVYDDPAKSPVHSNKVRQRIRPAPYFGRRNSVQVYDVSKLHYWYTKEQSLILFFFF